MHFFRQSNGDAGDRRIFTAVGSASVIGDVTVRLKHTAAASASGGVALGLDLRLPTGNEMNLLGSGTAGVQPFAVWSATYQKVSPHLNASYTWNRASVLAGNPATGTSADFSDQVGYTLGVDVSANPRLTLAFDVLGRYVIDSERLRQEDFHALDGRSVFPNIVFGRESFNALSGALGLKANLLERLLLDEHAQPLGEVGAALDGRLRQHHGELLAAVAGEKLFLANDGLHASSHLAEREVAAQVAQLVVDLLETVEVEQHQRQRPAIARRTSQLAVEELQQVALVEDLGKCVDDR